MTIPSNLYAEKIFSEHPTILWALDDNVDYISLISEADRNLSTWTITDATATTSSTNLEQPFQDSYLNYIEGDVPAGTSGSTICISPDIVSFSDLDPEKDSFAVGAYFYSLSPYLQSVEIGYEYTDPTSLTVVQQTKKFETTIFSTWSFVSETFPTVSVNADIRLVFKFNYFANEDSGPGDYDFYINGFSLGQWSENFNAISLGQYPTTLPASIPLENFDSFSADPYGIQSGNGYYLVKDNSLKAFNSAIPMVFGASNVTILKPNSDDPSLIVPGQGFLNKSGQNKEYTVEFWAKINANTYEPKRIFGPIKSTDGLYVESGFLTLVIGNSFGSHFVGEWYRPMLIHIRLIRNTASVLVNGAEVISFSIDTQSLDLPNLLDENGKDQDWLGFYAYENVSPIEIDCIAIYTYSVPVNVAKRRWVYGQAVLSPETINSAYGGTQAFIDYPFADYTANYNYPNFAKWEQGSFDNLSTSSGALSNPAYSLPNIFLASKSLQDLYVDNKEEQDVLDYKFVTFRPNNAWQSDQCYFNFPKFNILSTQNAAFYGVFSSDDLVSEEMLFKIYNVITGNYFTIIKDADEIKYTLFYNGITEEIYTTIPIASEEKFAVGLNINAITNYFGGNVSTFFGNQNGLKMYVGGDESGLNQFTGKIYTIGLSTAPNLLKIESYFDENGIAIVDDTSVSGYIEPENAIALIEHTASYTLLPSEAYDTYFLDVGISGTWQDYLPLSYFAQFVKNDVGNQYYDLDFLQFNLGYPPSTTLLENVEESYRYYDTENSAIRSYITFQYIDEGANLPDSHFINSVPAKEGSIVDMDLYEDWYTTKFEVIDNTLIYPTKSVDFNELAIVYSLDFNIRGILSKPISLRRLELASQALNDNSFNPIGTRFGVDMFPYTRAGLYYDYKTKNPFSIYKASTPYLYLNKTSGIEVRGEFDPLISRGISIPINQNVADTYRISAVQLWMMPYFDEFDQVAVELFEINYKADTIKFYIQPVGDDTKRARIFAKNQSTGEFFNGLTYYWNGALVREPFLTVKEWGSLGIRFSTALNFDLYLGGININGPVMFNNIAFYQANNLQLIQTNLTRPWLLVKTDSIEEFKWLYWFNNFIWEGVLIISSSDRYGVNPGDIYKTYIGTNKIIVDDNEGLLVDSDRLKIYNDTTWAIRVGTPV